MDNNLTLNLVRAGTMLSGSKIKWKNVLRSKWNDKIRKHLNSVNYISLEIDNVLSGIGIEKLIIKWQIKGLYILYG